MQLFVDGPARSGETLAVRCSEVAEPATVEVVVRERWKIAGMWRNGEDRSVASTVVDAGAASLAVDLPAGLSPDYDGEMVGWSYYLRSASPAAEIPLAILAAPPEHIAELDDEAAARTPLGSVLSPNVAGADMALNRVPGTDLFFAFLALGMVAVMLGSAVWLWGMEDGNSAMRVFAVILGVMGAAALVATIGGLRGWSLRGVRVEVPHRVVARGGRLVVDIDRGGLEDLVVHLDLAEAHRHTGGSHEVRNYLRTTTLSETPVLGSRVEIDVDAGAHPSFPGKTVALVYVVRVRKRSHGDGGGAIIVGVR